MQGAQGASEGDEPPRLIGQRSPLVYIAVMLYISVGFLDIAALPMYLAMVVKRDNPGIDEEQVAQHVATYSAACSFAMGIPAVFVAGWAGRLSDRYGRRRCAALPAFGQALGMALVSVVTYLELDWRFVLGAWAAMGIFGGPFVFLASAFAYIADFTRGSARGRAFASLDSLLLYVAACGPLVGATLVEAFGYVGVWAACACAYSMAALAFLSAPPSPQPKPSVSAPCREWLGSFTPVLLWRMLGDKRVRGLCIAFSLAMGGVNGGISTLVQYARHEAGWGQEQISYFIAAYSACAATFIIGTQPLLSCLLGRRVTDLSMCRGAYFGPVLFLCMLGFIPMARFNVAVFAMLPLACSGAVAIPHFRALFSRAKPVRI
jgi:MFS family permease